MLYRGIVRLGILIGHHIYFSLNVFYIGILQIIVYIMRSRWH